MSVLTLSTGESPRPIGRDRREPRSQALRFPQRPQLAPCDRPGSRDCLMGDIDIAAYQVGDPDHVVVMGRDDLREAT